MHAEVQVGETEGIVVVTVQEMPDPNHRWIKTYSTRAEAVEDLSRLFLVLPEDAAAFGALPVGSQVPAFVACIENVKEELKSFALFPLTHAQ